MSKSSKGLGDLEGNEGCNLNRTLLYEIMRFHEIEFSEIVTSKEIGVLYDVFT